VALGAGGAEGAAADLAREEVAPVVAQLVADGDINHEGPEADHPAAAGPGSSGPERPEEAVADRGAAECGSGASDPMCRVASLDLVGTQVSAGGENILMLVGPAARKAGAGPDEAAEKQADEVTKDLHRCRENAAQMTKLVAELSTEKKVTITPMACVAVEDGSIRSMAIAVAYRGPEILEILGSDELAKRLHWLQANASSFDLAVEPGSDAWIAALEGVHERQERRMRKQRSSTLSTATTKSMGRAEVRLLREELAEREKQLAEEAGRVVADATRAAAEAEAACQARAEESVEQLRAEVHRLQRRTRRLEAAQDGHKEDCNDIMKSEACIAQKAREALTVMWGELRDFAETHYIEQAKSMRTLEIHQQEKAEADREIETMKAELARDRRQERKGVPSPRRVTIVDPKVEEKTARHGASDRRKSHAHPRTELAAKQREQADELIKLIAEGFDTAMQHIDDMKPEVGRRKADTVARSLYAT